MKSYKITVSKPGFLIIVSTPEGHILLDYIVTKPNNLIRRMKELIRLNTGGV